MSQLPIALATNTPQIKLNLTQIEENCLRRSGSVPFSEGKKGFYVSWLSEKLY